MPEGPEVRKYADDLATALVGKRINLISARTKKAKQWLADNENKLVGRKIVSIKSIGKNIVGTVEGGFYFYSHQMMWGRWHVFEEQQQIEPQPKSLEVVPTNSGRPKGRGAKVKDSKDSDLKTKRSKSGQTKLKETKIEEPKKDRRERARIEVPGATAILMSAPIFEVGTGDPLEEVPFLASLGPDILDDKFAAKEFKRRLLLDANLDREIGDALLDQRICAGIGNYLRAEIMFLARLDPWTLVRNLKSTTVSKLSSLIPEVAKRSLNEQMTVTPELKAKMSADPALVYVPGREYGTRHYVFRRTNLPCLICGEPVRQLRQVSTNFASDDAEPNDANVDEADDTKSRIVYFCAKCQNVKIPAQLAKVKPQRKRKKQF